jgi:hypothetical protein
MHENAMATVRSLRSTRCVKHGTNQYSVFTKCCYQSEYQLLKSTLLLAVTKTPSEIYIPINATNGLTQWPLL